MGIEETFERIASALERIANVLESLEVKNNQKLMALKPSLDEGLDEKEFVNDIQDIEEFLNSKNIRIKSFKEIEDADGVLDKIALFIGKRYLFVKDLLMNVKRSLNTGRVFRMDLRNYSQEEIASITQLCSNLHQIAFLQEYKYFKSPDYILLASPNRIPKVINFFTGGWLERYIKNTIIEIISSCPENLSYSYLMNPQIILPNGDDFELDLIFRIEDEFFWFEAKTGDYQRYVEKYSRIAKILKLDNDHAYMILTDITKDGAQALRTLFHMNVVRIDDFPEVFGKVINKLCSKTKSELKTLTENLKEGNHEEQT
jgi:hypothetical protein